MAQQAEAAGFIEARCHLLLYRRCAGFYRVQVTRYTRYLIAGADFAGATVDSAISPPKSVDHAEVWRRRFPSSVARERLTSLGKRQRRDLSSMRRLPATTAGSPSRRPFEAGSRAATSVGAYRRAAQSTGRFRRRHSRSGVFCRDLLRRGLPTSPVKYLSRRFGLADAHAQRGWSA